VMVARKRRMVHKLAYELKHGLPVPDELEVDHLCRVRCCINPDHLEAVSRSVNVRRSSNRTMLTERNRSAEMRRLTAERNKTAEMREIVSRPKSPEHAAKLRAMLIKRNQSAEMRAIVSRPKSPTHCEAMRQAQLRRNRK